MQAVDDRPSPGEAGIGVVGHQVVLGEIHTGLLQSSTEITSDEARDLLALIPRSPVRTWERPIRHASSPERLTGIDSSLPSASGTVTRAVGTVATEARITSGRVLQVCSRTTVGEAEHRRRLPWSHYLSRPGTLEAWGNLRLDDLCDGFLRLDPPPGVLDLGGMCAHMMGEVQRSPQLDRPPPFRVSRTRLRWTAAGGTDETSPARLAFVLESPALRTMRITDAPPALVEHLPELCQDVALHDWLLSSVLSLVDLARIGERERLAVLEHLRPAVDHLLHAWMPAARLGDDLRAFWDEIERRSGLERQWGTVVRRIRDQIALVSATPAAPATSATRS